MGDSDLDYTILLPAATGLPGAQWDQEGEPVVFLLGWAGCKEKHLTKYSEIYHKQGCIVISHTAAWRTIFFAESFGLRSLRDEAKKLLDLLFDYEIEKNPIVFHVFSNGGFMLYRYIVELLRSHQRMRELHVVGTIFDSAPGNRNVFGSVKALNTILTANTNRFLRYLALAAFAVMVFILRIILYPMTRFLHENHYDAMIKDPSRWPQLYLYSRADHIISYLDVEKMVAARRYRHLPTESLDFQESEHVCHYRRYPERYSNICSKFLRDCIQRAASSAFMSDLPSY
ncbi:transmembrane protein 53 [Hyperolius riggenbachi]|uniref:transmembrane protein 53 n=1 Tax=Hyperolius riggenbachi TaxID=752182 RepID=UPI0035A3B775